MPRPMWKGAVSFGMVVIPVRMYPATAPRSINFHFLHKKCLTRPKQVRYCEVDNEYFGNEETVKGYEYTRGQFVVLEDKDFDKVPLKTLHAIEITGFVAAKEVDPRYYHSSYHLEPEELGVKPFLLLRTALVKAERMGVAKVTFARREHLCCLRPVDGTIMLHTMYYHDEIVPGAEAPPVEVKLAPDELELAGSLVKTMAKSFKPEEYKDDYRMALEKIVKAKLEGVTVRAPKAPAAKVTDLMAALRASIEAAGKKSKTEVPVGAAK